MKKIYVVILTIILTFAFEVSAQVAINTDGMPADGTAILDVKSTSQGLLIPRMSTANRTGITAPANGLLVFDTDTKSIWFYDLSSTSWKEIYGSNNNTKLADADGDTKVEVEQSTDEDAISFTMAGTEFIVFDSARIEILNSGSSVFIGEDAGKNDDYSANSNVAVGSSALLNNIGGARNIAIGFGTLQTNVNNNNCTAIGYNAMHYASSNNLGNAYNTAIGAFTLVGSTTATNNTGRENTAIGGLAMNHNTSGVQNTAIGFQALQENTIGEYNTSLGTNSLYANKGNSRSTAVGAYAMQWADNSTIGRETYNTAIGYRALSGDFPPSNNTGQYNTAVGDASLTAITEGSYNTAIGSDALIDNTSGSGNTAIGYNSLSSNITREYSTAVGINSLATLSTGSRNTAIGESSLYKLSSGSYNLALGGRAAYYMTSGSNNIFIGFDVSAPDLTGSNQLNIGNTIYGTDIHNSARKIGISTTSPDEALDVRGNFQVKQTSSAVTVNIESSTAAATLFIKSSGTNLGQISFYDNGSYGASIGYSNEADHIFIWHKFNNVLIDNGTILPGTHKGGDLGADGQAWDDIWCDDLHDVVATAFANRIVTEEIVNHPPKEKKEGSFDYSTKQGDVELDPLSLPDALHDKNSILTDEVVTYNYKANYEQQLQINEMKKIIEELHNTVDSQNEKMEQLMKLVTEK